MPQLSQGTLYLAGAIAGLVGITSIFAVPITLNSEADIRLEPSSGTLVINEPFTISVITDATRPVNVFKGDISFNPAVLQVESIDYNTSIADLWAEEPWYSNGVGTLNFIGGTTRQGGFIGTDTLITITFTPIATGAALIEFTEVRILKHDGLGSDADVGKPIDAVFTVDTEILEEQTVGSRSGGSSRVHIVETAPSTDLNGDGRQSIRDVSIFMSDLVSQNKRSDFNMDGQVTIADMSILLDAK